MTAISCRIFRFARSVRLLIRLPSAGPDRHVNAQDADKCRLNINMEIRVTIITRRAARPVPLHPSPARLPAVDAVVPNEGVRSNRVNANNARGEKEPTVPVKTCGNTARSRFSKVRSVHRCTETQFSAPSVATVFSAALAGVAVAFCPPKSTNGTQSCTEMQTGNDFSSKLIQMFSAAPGWGSGKTPKNETN